MVMVMFMVLIASMAIIMVPIMIGMLVVAFHLVLLLVVPILRLPSCPREIPMMHHIVGVSFTGPCTLERVADEIVLAVRTKDFIRH